MLLAVGVLSTSAFATHSPTLTGITQQNGDSSALAPGATATTADVILCGLTGSGMAGGQMWAEFEVVPLTTGFANAPTHQSTPQGTVGSSGTAQCATISGLSPDDYHWQARQARDTGTRSAWSQFQGGSLAFVISAGGGTGPAVPAASTTSLAITATLLLVSVGIVMAGRKTA
jgi:hypothetical protein